MIDERDSVNFAVFGNSEFTILPWIARHV